MGKQELSQYIEKYRKLLVESIEWWQKYTPDVKHGGFYNYLVRAGGRDVGRGVLYAFLAIVAIFAAMYLTASFIQGKQHLQDNEEMTV